MKVKLMLCVSLVAVAPALPAQDKIPLLRAGIHTYTNVVVTSVSATDIYFTHAQGMGNAKLQDLPPDLQQRFNYNPAKAADAAQKQSKASAQYRAAAAAEKTLPKPVAAKSAPVGLSAAEIQVPEIHAKSFKGGPPPALVVEKWLTAEPNRAGKFVLVDFWATWCGPCRRSIPALNRFHAKFGDQLVIIGLSDETEREVRAMKSPEMEYAVAIDPQGRMKRAAQVRGIPHAMLIDPKGIVRFEGHPGYLNERALAALLKKYGE